MAGVELGVRDNIDTVIRSIDKFERGLRREIRKRVGRAMAMCAQRARMYVQRDADYKGNLHDSITIERDSRKRSLSFSVFTDNAIAPYAAIVEFGSGQNGARGNEWVGSQSVGQPDRYPPNFPFDSPDIDINQSNPYNLTGKRAFAGFVGHIEEWMSTKPVTPRSGDMFTSAVAIAKEIIEKGNLAHPFMRPAWFDSELRVRKAAANAVKNATR